MLFLRDSLVSLLLTLWAVGAIYYSNLPIPFLRVLGAALFPLIAIFMFWRIRPFRKGLLGFGAMWIAVLVWWLLIPPSNQRTWQPDVTVLPSFTIDGDKITAHKIRNCAYRTPTDFDVSVYDKSYDLSKLQGADLFLCYWGPTKIAHTIMTFCFEGDQFLCISIETRKEIGEDYSAVKGFFKQYELYYVVGDERDLIRLRTNFRGEDVYLYRLTAKSELVRSVLMDYLATINQLNETPQWYNALPQNCSTAIRGHARPYTHGRMSWKILANGYLDTLLYERKSIDTTMPFEQIKAASHINKKALNAGNNADFSIQIRQGLPSPH